jgi:heme exporter protein D
MPEENETGSGFSLNVQSQMADSATIPVRWCISPDLAEKLKERELDHIHVLIVVRSKASGHEHRYLVPFTDATRYIQFASPGDNLVCALLLRVHGREKPGSLRDTYKTRKNGEYITDVISPRGYILAVSDLFGHETHDMCTVNVGEEFFAKEPPQWLKKWGNLWFETKPRDQCQFRRRLILAFTLQPLVVGPYVALKVMFLLLFALALLLLGRKGIYWNAVIHPFTYEPSHVLRPPRHAQKDTGWMFAGRFTWCLSPFFIILLGALVWSTWGLLWGFSFDFQGILLSLLFGFSGALLLSMVSLVVVAVRSIIGSENWLKKKRAKAAREARRKQELEEEEQRAKKAQRERELEFLQCSLVDREDILKVPKKKRRFTLMLDGLKATVCKPFRQ